MCKIPTTGPITVPAEIFELAPEIQDMKYFDFPGAVFSTGQLLEKFSIFITFELNSDSYYSDRPLKINEVKITSDNLGQIDLSTYGFNGQIKDLAALDALKQISGENVQATLEGCTTAIENMDTLKADPLNAPGCPELTEEEQLALEEANALTTEITDLEGNVLKTIYTQLENRPFQCPNATDTNAEITANILSDIQIPGIDSTLPELRPPVCNLPDSGPHKEAILDAMTTANVHTNITGTNVGSLNKNIQNIINEQVQAMSLTTPDQSPEDADANVKVVQELLTPPDLMQYGIPLIVLNKELNIIIHIVDGELQVLNFDKSSTELNLAKNSFKIDIIENPGARILPDTKYTLMYNRKYNTHKLQLHKEYTDEIYTKEVQSEVDTGYFYLGTDKAGLKHFCGKFYDVHLSLDSLTNINQYNSKKLFMKEIIGALAFYDFYNPGINYATSRIHYNKVYPFKNIMNPISMRGEYTLEDKLTNNYTFMNHGFIDDIFCKDFFLKKSFTISIWINKNRHLDQPDDFRVRRRQMIISDNINENYIYYDESTFELVIEFHGFQHKMFFNIVPQIWNFITFRYNAPIQKFFIDISIRRKDATGTFQTETFSESFDLDTDINTASQKDFKLLNILAEYVWEEREHQNRFDCLCGPIILYDSFQTDIILDRNFQNQWPVLQEYKYSGIGGIEAIQQS
jgi:hypothetical protein